MAKRQSPTSRTLAAIRKLGGIAGVVEKRVPGMPHITQDLFGFIDIVCLLGPNIIGIQATDSTNHSHRRDKILAEPRALAWLKAGGLIEIWSWSMTGARGERKLWTARKEEIVLTDFLKEHP